MPARCSPKTLTYPLPRPPRGTLTMLPRYSFTTVALLLAVTLARGAEPPVEDLPRAEAPRSTLQSIQVFPLNSAWMGRAMPNG